MRVLLLLFLLFAGPARAGAAAPIFKGRNVYDFFGVSPKSADPEADFKAAYRSLVKRYHPDRNPGNKRAEETMKLVTEMMAEVRKQGYYGRFAPKPAPEPKPEPKPAPKPEPKPEAPADPRARAAADAYSRPAGGSASRGNYFPYRGQYEKAASPDSSCAKLFATL